MLLGVSRVYLNTTVGVIFSAEAAVLRRRNQMVLKVHCLSYLGSAAWVVAALQGAADCDDGGREK